MERVRRTSDLDEATLLKAVENEPPITKRPATLRLRDIHVAPKVFQWRSGSELLKRNEHLDSLVRALASNQPPKPFDALLMWAAGKRFFVLDGHNRVDAYATFGWKGAVPVEYFEGTLAEAQLEAWKHNAKDKLAFTQPERLEAAWKLVKRGDLTRTKITALTTVRRATLTKMRNMRTKYPQVAEAKSWADILTFARGTREPLNRADWQQAVGRKIADHLTRGPREIKNADTFAIAIRMLRQDYPRALIGEWWPDVRNAMLQHIEERVSDRETDEGEADQLRSQIEELFDALFPELPWDPDDDEEANEDTGHPLRL